jgi:hypothetical protein
VIFDDDRKWRLHVSGGKIEDFRNPMLARIIEAVAADICTDIRLCF